jgi:hypothetical protein
MTVTVINGATGEVGISGRRVEEVMRGTWGHLDAHPGTRYRATITFAEGLYGDLVILDVDCKASGGPWFYEGIQDWLCEQETEPGRIYRLDGHYCLRAGGRHEFTGTITEKPL